MMKLEAKAVAVLAREAAFLGLLWVLLIALKLPGHLDWSWWWVNAPCWGPLGLVLVITFIARHRTTQAEEQCDDEAQKP